jgi:mannose-1-phosphate guanylyltransferase
MNQLFLEGFEKYNTSEEKEFINQNYAEAENISIDYAILEKAKNVFVLPATFDWNDLGTWGSLHEKLGKDNQNNAVLNTILVSENASNNIIRTQNKKLVIIDGLNDYIVVEHGDVLLIYPKVKEQDIKKVVSNIDFLGVKL